MKTIATLLVVLHLAVVMVHGQAHQQLHIDPSMWQRVFIVTVILIGPVLAMALLWTHFKRVGYVVLLVTMAGSLVFGLAYHFLVHGSDNALELQSGHWESLFGTTAVWLAVTEAAAVVWSALALKKDQASQSTEKRADRAWS
jgi:hypothetical protein